MNTIKFLRGTWWGASAECLSLLYKSFVRPIIDCACFIYYPKQKAQIEKLETMHHTAIRLSFC